MSCCCGTALEGHRHLGTSIIDPERVEDDPSIQTGRRTTSKRKRGGITHSIMALRLSGIGRRLPLGMKEELQRRAYWQEIVRIRTDKDGKRRHEDPSRVVRRFQDQRRSDGESLLELNFYNDRHEKAWMKRQRLKLKRQYESDKKHVMDLAKYIQFVQDNKTK